MTSSIRLNRKWRMWDLLSSIFNVDFILSTIVWSVGASKRPISIIIRYLDFSRVIVRSLLKQRKLGNLHLYMTFFAYIPALALPGHRSQLRWCQPQSRPEWRQEFRRMRLLSRILSPSQAQPLGGLSYEWACLSIIVSAALLKPSRNNFNIIIATNIRVWNLLSVRPILYGGNDWRSFFRRLIRAGIGTVPVVSDVRLLFHTYYVHGQRGMPCF
jgi:hypothetical protein